MSTKQKVIERCKAVAESGNPCAESGVNVWAQEGNDGAFFELVYDGGHLCIWTCGSGEGFDAAARWLKLDNPWRLTSEELPKRNTEVLANWGDTAYATALQHGGIWYYNGRSVSSPVHWMPIPLKPE